MAQTTTSQFSLSLSLSTVFTVLFSFHTLTNCSPLSSVFLTTLLAVSYTGFLTPPHTISSYSPKPRPRSYISCPPPPVSLSLSLLYKLFLFSTCNSFSPLNCSQVSTVDSFLFLHNNQPSSFYSLTLLSSHRIVVSSFLNLCPISMFLLPFILHLSFSFFLSFFFFPPLFFCF
ncbi:unnamed protein product [Acanthosepion pharaonis]|uniref:Uncharacterized protein n=1 Tax=Acanthosepion pharaonis TaxID=158019 RepID=A0A812BBP9_ACAPH|nr:unnamed protein product [Sepia pharaonis]